MSETDPRSLLITDVQVFDGESTTLHEGPVLVRQGHVVAVGAAVTDEVAATGEPSREFSARGGTVLPGLIDAHFHAYAASLNMVENETLGLSYVAHVAGQRLNRALSRGFTTVRDVAGGDPGLARSVDEGLFASPRYLYSGAALSQTGGHGDPRPQDQHLCGCGGRSVEVVDGVDDLRRAVRERLRTGAHVIKIMTSGGVISPTDPLVVPQYSPEEICVVVEEAHRRGSYVAAHAYSPEAIEHSVTHGVTSIEHGNLLDTATAQLMAARSAFLVPTLATYAAMDRRGADLGLSAASQTKNREVLDAGQRAVELAHAASVRVGFGTDLMGRLEDEQLLGLQMQSDVCGPAQTLISATSVNAHLLRRDDLGRIRPGAIADLVVVQGNPLEDITRIADPDSPRLVIRGGDLTSAAAQTLKDWV